MKVGRGDGRANVRLNDQHLVAGLLAFMLFQCSAAHTIIITYVPATTMMGATTT